MFDAPTASSCRGPGMADLAADRGNRVECVGARRSQNGGAAEEVQRPPGTISIHARPALQGERKVADASRPQSAASEFHG